VKCICIHTVNYIHKYTQLIHNLSRTHARTHTHTHTHAHTRMHTHAHTRTHTHTQHTHNIHTQHTHTHTHTHAQPHTCILIELEEATWDWSGKTYEVVCIIHFMQSMPKQGVL